MENRSRTQKNRRNGVMERMLCAALIVSACMVGGVMTAGTASGTAQKKTETEPMTEWITEGLSESDSVTDTEEQEETESEFWTEAREETESEFWTEVQEETESEFWTEAQEETESEFWTEVQEETESEFWTEVQEETEDGPERIVRGIHYELLGDPGAFCRDENDRLWVRKGSGISVQPVSAERYNRGASAIGLETDGELEFTLQYVDAEGNVAAESGRMTEAYYTDGEAPRADVVVEGILEGGIAYVSGEAVVRLAIEPDGKSGLRSAAYCVVPCAGDGTWLGRPDECIWTECRNGQNVSVKEEGTYQIYIRTEDRVGNLGFFDSIPFCVDQTAPEIVVEGVLDQTANNGEVPISISCEDTNYKEGSLNISITGLNQGKTPVQQKKLENSSGAMVWYYDFPEEKGYDDMYRLQISAEDRVGNRAEKVLEFSVNRFGSVYNLADETSAQLAHYYLAAPADIVFNETNIDYVGTAEIYCRCDGELLILEKGRDYQVSMEGETHTWKQYRYTIPAAYFQKDGVYELLLTSGDMASNVSDTGLQEKRVVFVLDRTGPSCTIAGVESGMVYEADSVPVFVTPHDNSGVEEMRIYCDDQLIRTENGIEPDETISVQLNASDSWQTFQAYVRDFAGNEFWSDQISVYVNRNQESIPDYVPDRPKGQEPREQMQSETEEQDLAFEVPSAGNGGNTREKGKERIRSYRFAVLIGLLMTAVVMLIISGYILLGSRRKR